MYVETLPTKWHSKIQIFNRPWLDQTFIYKQEMYDFLGVLLAILLKMILIVILWSFFDKNLIFMVIL